MLVTLKQAVDLGFNPLHVIEHANGELFAAFSDSHADYLKHLFGDASIHPLPILQSGKYLIVYGNDNYVEFEPTYVALLEMYTKRETVGNYNFALQFASHNHKHKDYRIVSAGDLGYLSDCLIWGQINSRKIPVGAIYTDFNDYQIRGCFVTRWENQHRPIMMALKD